MGEAALAVWQRGRVFWYWMPALTWMGLIFYLSSKTSGDLQGWFPFVPDLNWGHLGGYLVLAVLFRYALERTTATARPGAWAVLSSVLYGITDEFHQYFVPTRSPDVKDLAVDAAGALTGVLCMAWWKRYKATKVKGDPY